jgi:polar amino acid transport system substrate-binding protein
MKQSTITLILFVMLLALMGVYYVYQTPSSCCSCAHHNHGAEHTEQQLMVGTNAAFPPFTYQKDGEIIGFDIDLIKAVGQELDKEVIIKDMAFDALLMDAQSGRINVIAAGMSPTPERAKQLNFTKPHLEQDPLVVITLAAHTPQSIEDLNDKAVVVNDGYTAESYMKKMQEQHPTIDVKSLATPAESFLALSNGRAYAYVSSRSAVQPFFDQYGTEKFHILTLPESDSYALAVPKAYPELFAEIQQALDALERNGTLTQLKNKWHLNF